LLWCSTRICRSSGIPEHERFLEESWLFEAITESYLPLIQIIDGWLRDGLPAG
jgi:predicted glycosyl hydrolase (DUF1957 family)